MFSSLFSAFCTFLLGWIALCGLRILKPQEALVLTLFGKYIGTLKGEGFYYVNPFCSACQPRGQDEAQPERRCGRRPQGRHRDRCQQDASASIEVGGNKKISLKIMTLNNTRQKINDCLGNPVEIGIAVMWRVVDTAKAVFNVDNYKEYLSLQCDSGSAQYRAHLSLRRRAERRHDRRRSWPTRAACAARARSWPRASAMRSRPKVADAGLEIIEARITYLAYAPEIAAVMLQRQQASAIIDARKMIVDGAVGMVEMALERLSENKARSSSTRSARRPWYRTCWWCSAATATRSPSSTPAACTDMAETEREKKQVPLRLSPKLYDAIAAWAEDDFRSVNGQIEYLLTECVRQRKKNGKYVSDELDKPPELDI